MAYSHMRRLHNTILLPWEELPEFMRIPEVRPYWEILDRRRLQLRLKRFFDFALSVVMIIILLFPMLIIVVAVKLDSPGPVFYRQVRVTQYGKRFMINKFRTMYDEASKKNAKGEQVGSNVTVANDSRVTKVGRVLRKYRLDEFPQLFNVLVGDMSFVGTRPEVPMYVNQYEAEWYATLLMPAGITSECSIRYKDEGILLSETTDVDRTYMTQILPEKMRWNLKSLMKFSLFFEIDTMVRTMIAVSERE